jgi:nitrite reductase/ring-hydroxylating ferredoxin subunit
MKREVPTTTVAVCRADDLAEGARRVVVIDHRQISVLNVGGHLYAIRNRCPHQGGPLGYGQVGGTLLPSEPGHLSYGLEDRVVTCPWHHWEFDLVDGTTIVDSRMRVKTYDVFVEDGEIRLSLGTPSPVQAVKE